MKRHLLIAGPGRAGTTLLVQLLGEVGLDTGADLRYFPDAKAGLESNIQDPDAAYVVKNPAIPLRALLDAGTVDPRAIDALVIPLRDIDQATASRLAVAAAARRMALWAPGGLTGTQRPRRQRAVLAERTYSQIQAAAAYEIPLIVLEYPRFATDPDYAFRRLRDVLPGVGQEQFGAAVARVVDPSLLRADPIPAGMRVRGELVLRRNQTRVARRLRRYLTQLSRLLRR